MTDNKLSGAELKNLVKYTELIVIKFAANNVKELSELAVLTDLKNLENLDLGDNPVTTAEGYREKVLEMFPDLVVLDNITRDGVEYISEDDEDYDDEEEGEGEAPEGADEEGEFDDEDGEVDYDDEYGDEEGEEGDDQDDDEESAELGKRKK